MFVDGERVKRMTQFFRGAASRAASLGLKNEYSFTDFCEQNGLFKKGKEFRAGGTWIVCPFHADDSPSLSFNEDKGIWHCFGCGCGGNYLDFIYLYETKVLCKEITKISFLNGMLRNDPKLCQQLGFTTLYKEQLITAESLTVVEKPKFVYRERIPDTYVELQEKFLKTNPSIQKIKMFIVMMQEGIDLKAMYKELFNQDSETKDFNYDLSKMDQF